METDDKTQNIPEMTGDTTGVTFGDSTLRPADGIDIGVTAGVDDDVTERTGHNGTPGGQGIAGGSERFVLKGVEYHKEACLSASSGEAQVFLVSRDGKEYVLKVYYPNNDINKKLLRVIRSFDFELIVRLYDFGKTYVEGKHRYYELMEYLRGGTLNKYNVGGDLNQFRRLALQGAAALAYCHNNNILHKDVKPSNFFFRDESHKELVLGDFGISTLFGPDGKSLRTSQARTPIYAAPEMYSDVIDGVVELTPAADYYSLGITLFALWLGENPMSLNERVMMRQKNEGRLPRLNELPDQVKRIVQGLTSVNPASRWGYEQVERWFLGEEVAVDISSPFLKYKSFIVDPDHNLVADNVHELIPLLIDNVRLAIGYLYNGRIRQWLESCGNMKLATVVNDIVVNRYPADQHAGLMAAVYAMEPTYPYRDVGGNVCDDVHSVAISLLSYMSQYGVLLQNPNDNLFLYLEAHSKCNVNRLRAYFKSPETGVVTKTPRIAIQRMVYEIDGDIPFLPKMPSSTVGQIVRSFGKGDLSEDEWRSLTDGRLLSWMYTHEDKMARESLRILTADQPYSKALAYKVLYNLDREAAYDLRDADTPEKVGALLNKQLKSAEHLNDKDFARELEDFIDPNGRFAYFAQLHGWTEQLAEITRLLDMKSDENRERLGICDQKTALYSFCAVLGVKPTYLLPDGIELTDGRKIPPSAYNQVRNEMRSGNLLQWMSVYYHEDPARDFSQQYSYEHELEKWVMDLGEIDPSQTYYKRFIDARNETTRRMQDVRRSWKNARRKEQGWRLAFYVLCGVWALMVAVLGISGRDFLLRHSFITIGLPLGGMTALIVATRSFFRGYGFLISVIWGLLGALSASIPIMTMKFLSSQGTLTFSIGVLVITAIYMLVCHLTDFRGEQHSDMKLINDVLDDDIKSSLIEPLFYTFKTKSYKYKSSKFGLMDDVANQVHSFSGESVLHYILWCMLVAVLIMEFVVFHPALLNMPNPNLDNSWKAKPHTEKVIKQIELDNKQ